MTMMANTEAVIGIDLGTTSEETLVGQAALNQCHSNAQNTVFDAKRLIGRRFSDKCVQENKLIWPFHVVAGSQDEAMIQVTCEGGEIRTLKPEQISSMILKKMKETAEDYLKCQVKKAVVTVPAYFCDSQRQATKVAAELAGLEVLKLLNEPEAAAIAYSSYSSSATTHTSFMQREGERMLVYDLGGGTFDVAVLEVLSNREFRVKATKGNSHLGGQDFDNRLLNYLMRKFNRKAGLDISGNPKAVRRLHRASERAKRELSSAISTVVDVPCLHQSVDLCCTVSREKFEQMNMNLFMETLRLVEECIQDVGWMKSDITSVVLVGGSSRIPKIQQLLQDLFHFLRPRPAATPTLLHWSINPDEVVAYGAAVEAARLAQCYNPLSLGIGCQGEIMKVLIPRNTPIPVKRTCRIITCANNQTSIAIKVFQGERANAQNNLFLKELSMSVPLGPPRKEGLYVSMEIDAYGILTVTLEQPTTKTKKVFQVSRKSASLKAKEINNLIAKSEKFKMKDEAWKNLTLSKRDLMDDIEDAKNRLNDLKVIMKKQKVPARLVKKLDKLITENVSFNMDMGDLKHKKESLQSKEEQLKALIESNKKRNTTFYKFVSGIVHFLHKS